MAKKFKNLLFFGIDSLRRDHMSLYGYHRLTTPHLDKYLEDGVVFNKCFSPSIPTSSGYSSMITGLDCFSTDVVALRHKGDMAPGVKTLAEILGEKGYNTSCVGFKGNIGGRGYQKYTEFNGWGSDTPDGYSHKAENLNAVAIPELERLAKEDKPFFLFLRHMDPHAPYNPPEPFRKLFYQGDEFDKNNKSLVPLYNFKPFRDFFLTWFPPGTTDSNFVIALYDAAVAYMDSTMANIYQKLADLGLEEDTLVVFTSDHGETHYDHDCFFDHHGLYEPTLVVPFAFKMKGCCCCQGMRFDDYCQLKDVTPTILDLLDIKTNIKFDGRSMVNLVAGKPFRQECEAYITECTWMRKHGWRTPEWKLIVALEPDFHYKPEVELYNLILDPLENNNVAEKEPAVVEYLKKRMLAHIAKREKATGRTNPMYRNENWNNAGHYFTSSDEAYNTLHIGDPQQAAKLAQKLKTIGVDIKKDKK